MEVLDVDPNVQLLLYVIPTLIGFLFVLPFSSSLSKPFEERFPSLSNERGRLFFGLILTTLAGFAVSIQTLWISSKVSEGGNFCASSSVFHVMMSLEMPNTTPTPYSAFRGVVSVQ